MTKEDRLQKQKTQNEKRSSRIEKQKMRLAEMKEYEDSLRSRGYRYIAGVDEVGRGPLAGPVVAAAVVLPADFDVLGIDDSKKLSEKKREELFDLIRERAVAYGIGMADEQVIDEINILQATKVAMREAVAALEKGLQEKQSGGESAGRGSAADGSSELPKLEYLLFDAVQIDEIGIPQESIIKGDAKVLAIAASSILAKVTRDRMMVEYAKQYPGYGFEKNKGYGTKDHYAGLDRQGACPIHRQTFLRKWRGERV